MRESPLKAGILGLDESGRFLLEATRELNLFKIVALADSDTNLAQQFGKLWNCAAFDDYRQLIMQNQLDCLFVAAPLHTCIDYLRIAIKKKFNIFKLPPLGRNYTESAELTRLSLSEGVAFSVSSPARFSGSSLAMRNYIQGNQDSRFSFILAVSGIIKEEISKWRSDPTLAGGGVFLYDCWEIIDRIVWNFGVPQQVYSIMGSAAPDRQQRAYLTEDSALITMKFNDILSGTIIAGRSAGIFGPDEQKWLTARQRDLTIHIDDKCFEVIDSLGQIVKREEFNDDFLSTLKKSIANFGSHLLEPQNNPLIGSAAEHLKNMAVIEAAYLSARTGMPEEPARILKIA